MKNKDTSKKKDNGTMRDFVSLRFFGIQLKGKVRGCLTAGGVLMFMGAMGYTLYRGIKSHFDEKDLKAKTKSEIKKIMARRISQNNPSQDYCQESIPNYENLSSNEVEVRSWLENFDVDFPLKYPQMPPIISDYLAYAPNGFDMPVIVALTVELAGCFSNVRAKYLDEKFHRPNIMAVIEAPFSSLKGQI